MAIQAIDRKTFQETVKGKADPLLNYLSTVT